MTIRGFSPSLVQLNRFPNTSWGCFHVKLDCQFYRKPEKLGIACNCNILFCNYYSNSLSAMWLATLLYCPNQKWHNLNNAQPKRTDQNNQVKSIKACITVWKHWRHSARNENEMRRKLWLRWWSMFFSTINSIIFWSLSIWKQDLSCSREVFSLSLNYFVAVIRKYRWEDEKKNYNQIVTAAVI